MANLRKFKNNARLNMKTELINRIKMTIGGKIKKYSILRRLAIQIIPLRPSSKKSINPEGKII